MTLRNTVRAGLVLLAVVVLLGVFVVAKVVYDKATAADDVLGGATPVATAELGGTQPGSLVSAVTMPRLDAKLGAIANAARVVYRSTSGDGGPGTEVSGTVFTPKGRPPDGGWPVVSYGHGTTGVQQPCAPSLSSSLLGQAPTITGLVTYGYAVAFADYQGLGHDGIHPYLDAKTAGLNMIDAVRALRHTFPDVSTRWAAFGASQGGGAAWAADEQADGYAPELTHVGAVALSPAVDMTGLVDKAEQGSMTTDQAPLLQWMVLSLGRLHPDLNLDDYRRGSAAQNWDALSACSGPLTAKRSAAAAELGPRELAPSTPAAAARLRSLVGAWALPQRPLSAPLSVVYGSADTYIDPQWTTDAIARACSLRGTVVWRLEQGKGHDTIDGNDQLAWIADRFAGKAVTSGCR